MVGEMSVRENVLLGKCPVGEVSFGEVSVGDLSSGKCHSGKCTVGKLSYNRYYDIYDITGRKTYPCFPQVEQGKII